tara:strand:+ start:361 stop:1059 length:699 start_codon:yes stop_codon:yes gene_type:complete
MGKRGPKPQRNVTTSWSRELAYVVGLITADGCLSKDGRHIEFTSKDKELVYTFRRCLNLKNTVGKKISGYTGRKDYYRIQFGDVHFHTWLQKIGLSPRKSKTVGKLRIPKRYFFDFLRGCFDGDGTIYSYWDPRWHSSYMFYTAFASASLAHLKWLQTTIEKTASISGKITRASRAYQLRYAKASSRTLFKKMFVGRKTHYLKRKFLKAKRIFEIDDTHSQAQMAESVYAAA